MKRVTKNLLLIGVAIILIIALDVADDMLRNEISAELITEDELPKGYIVQAKMDENDDSNDAVRISRGPYSLGLGQTYAEDNETKIKFCGFSDSGEIYLSVNDGDICELKELAASVPNSNYYVSYKNLDKKRIDIRWSVVLQNGESILLLSGQNLTFEGFDKNKSIFSIG